MAKMASPDFAMMSETLSGRNPRIGAADAEQNASDRQDRDRQHHAFADFLQKREGVFEIEHDLVSEFGLERADFLDRRALQSALRQFATMSVS